MNNFLINLIMKQNIYIKSILRKSSSKSNFFHPIKHTYININGMKMIESIIMTKEIIE